MPDALVVIVLLFLIFGGAGAVAEVFNGQRQRAALKRELKASQQRERELQARLDKALNATPGGPEIAGVIAQARGAIDDRAILIDALNQVQATDNVVPQLPQQVRDLVDDALNRHRERLASAAVPALPAGKKRGR